MDEQGITPLVGIAFEVGGSLRNFGDTNTATDHEFRRFADDVNALARACYMIQELLRDPSVALTPALLRILGRISHDGRDILTRLQESIATLDARYRNIGIAARRNLFLRVGSNHRTQQHQLLITFLGRTPVVLHRSQIIFATLTLNVILVVIQ